MDLSTVLTIFTLHSLALVSPGPDFVLAVRNSVQFGKTKGAYTGLGFAAGIAVHVTYCLAGVAVLLKTYPQVQTGIRIIGALYIIWIGIQSLRFAKSKTDRNQFSTGLSIERSSFECFKQGLLTNLLNPKATLFILGLFTTVINESHGLPTLVVVAFMMVIQTALWFLFVAQVFGSEALRVQYLRAEYGLNIAFALFFITAGVLVLLK